MKTAVSALKKPHRNSRTDEPPTPVFSRVQTHIAWTSAARSVQRALFSPDANRTGIPSNAVDVVPHAREQRAQINKIVRQVVRQTVRQVPFANAARLPDSFKVLAAMTAEIDVSLVDDGRMQELNAAYRSKDRPTDVLSFALGEGEIFPTGDDCLALGDLVISIETAARQAAERRHSLPYEMAFLAVHGTLHLLGYDHLTAPQRRVMWRWQDMMMQWWQENGERCGADAAP